MSVGQVIRHFEGIAKVPVDIKDVLATIRGIYPHLNIKIRGVNVDPKRLHGNCYSYKIDDSQILQPRFISMVVYSTQDHPFMQRFVCCKELVNIMDPSPMYTKTRQHVINLAERVTKPMTVPNRVTDLQVFMDHLAKLHALAILFPFGLWEELMPKHRVGKLNLEKLAERVELPIQYLNTIMTDEWKKVRETILG
jgi:hypothetical protein